MSPTASPNDLVPTASPPPPPSQVALIYSVNEPAAFAAAFYACIFACVIPIAIDPPITKEVGKCTVQPGYGNMYKFCTLCTDCVLCNTTCTCTHTVRVSLDTVVPGVESAPDLFVLSFGGVAGVLLPLHACVLNRYHDNPTVHPCGTVIVVCYCMCLLV